MYKCKFLFSLLIFFNINALKITRAIISWDNNPQFNYFWPIVSKAWSELIGVKPTLIFIGSKYSSIDTTYGDVVYIDPIIGIPTAFQAMAIRPLAAALFPDDYCILSDLDMIPINKQYFESAVNDLPDNHFAVFYPFFYGKKNLRYMMCYNVAKGSTFSEVFGVKDIADIRRTLNNWYKSYYKVYSYTTDEKMLYKYLNAWKNKNTRLNLLNLNFIRLNREKWEYKKNRVEKRLYADAHLPRPYDKYKNEIDDLLELLKINI